MTFCVEIWVWRGRRKRNSERTPWGDQKGGWRVDRKSADCMWEGNTVRSLGRRAAEALGGSALLFHRLQAVSRQDLAPTSDSKLSLNFPSLSSLVCWVPQPVLPTCPALLTGWPCYTWRCPVIVFTISCLRTVAPGQPRPAYSSREYAPSSLWHHLTPVLTYLSPAKSSYPIWMITVKPQCAKQCLYTVGVSKACWHANSLIGCLSLK